MTAQPLTFADRLRVAAAVGGSFTLRADPDELRSLARAIDHCNGLWAAAEAAARGRAAARYLQDQEVARKRAIWRDVLICTTAVETLGIALAALCAS